MLTIFSGLGRAAKCLYYSITAVHALAYYMLNIDFVYFFLRRYLFKKIYTFHILTTNKTTKKKKKKLNSISANVLYFLMQLIKVNESIFHVLNFYRLWGNWLRWSLSVCLGQWQCLHILCTLWLRRVISNMRVSTHHIKSFHPKAWYRLSIVIIIKGYCQRLVLWICLHFILHIDYPVHSVQYFILLRVTIWASKEQRTFAFVFDRRVSMMQKRHK